jgi:hypothetical protein
MFRDDLHDDEPDASVLSRWLLEFRDDELDSRDDYEVLPTPLHVSGVGLPVAGERGLS